MIMLIFQFVVCSVSFILPPFHDIPPKPQGPQQPSRRQSGGGSSCWVVGWEWRTRDTDASRVLGAFSFFFSFLFTNTTFTGTKLTITTATVLLEPDDKPYINKETDDVSCIISKFFFKFFFCFFLFING